MCTLLYVRWWQTCNLSLQTLLYQNFYTGEKTSCEDFGITVQMLLPEQASRCLKVAKCGKCWSNWS